MSVLHIAPEAPVWVHALAGTVLVLHIGGGTLGIASGAVAVLAPKGERVHRAAGHVFFVSMLVMAAIGCVVSPMLDDRVSSAMGLFTFYLVASAWMTVHRPEGQVGRVEKAAVVLALTAAAVLFTLAWIGAHSPRGLVDKLPYQIGLVFGAIATLAALTDLRMIRRGGISGVSRISRHIWRMCLGFFIAAGSLFLGQPQVFPEALRGGPLLTLLALAPLAALVFWMIRVRIGRRYRTVAA